MIKLTREQRKALKRIYDRGANWYGKGYPATYRQFRRTVQHGYDCIMVHAGGMFLGIEKDGYTHS